MRYRAGSVAAPALGVSVTALYLSVIVLLPLAALIDKSTEGDPWTAFTNPQSRAALEFTLAASAVVALVNTVTGLLLAWVLVRDDFPGRRAVNAIIDLPFALPTIVAGLTLLALYGPRSPLGINVAFTRAAVVLALLFVTLPFVVRAVQPVLESLDGEVEEAAASLGAKPATVFFRVVLPPLRPALLAGAGLAFGRSLGEFGSVVIISGNLPYRTEVSSVDIFNRIENGDIPNAAAVSMVLLTISFVLVLVLRVLATRGLRRERA